MNSKELEASLHHIFQGFNPDTFEVKVITKSELYNFKISKPRTFLVVFVQAHPSNNKVGHFVCFTVRKSGKFIDLFEFFDTFSKPVDFYFKDLPFETTCLDHPVYQDDDSKDCALICLFYILQMQWAPYARVIEHFDHLANSKYLLTKCRDYYLNISYNITHAPEKEDDVIYLPQEKKLALLYLENQK